jgi:5-methylcytosine-specific restriction endonuclease McrA
VKTWCLDCNRDIPVSMGPRCKECARIRKREWRKRTYNGKPWNGWAWDKRRKEALARDGYRCRKCGAGGQVRVHHINGWEGGDSLEVLITLCDDCHLEAHGGHYRGKPRGGVK